MQKIQAIIVDDEKLAIDTLKWQLDEFVTEVEIIGSFTNPQNALESELSKRAELCFLDIDMPEMSGFEFLKSWDSVPFEVIFTTAYSDYAIQAFRVSAFDYLLKPVDKEELISTVKKYNEQRTNPRLQERLKLLSDQFFSKELYAKRIALSTIDGVFFVDIEQIIRLESEKNYTTVYLLDAKPIIVSRTLKDVERVLDPNRFVRIHQSHNVDINKIDLYQRGRGGSVKMSTGETIPVSKYRKEELMKKLGL